MSRPSHLPPRCLHQTRSSSTIALDSASQSSHQDGAHLYRFPSLDSILEEQPLGLDQLLSHSETSRTRSLLRRSTSDPVGFMDACDAFHSLAHTVSEGVNVSTSLDESVGSVRGGESGLEASCLYGPNSPRQRSRETDSDSSMVAALLENVPWNPLQYAPLDFSGVSESNVNGDAHGDVGDSDLEKATRRRSGQRSRVRKLQYIAELERAVDNLQTLGAELAVRVSSQFQQRLALSMENKKLKQQVIFHRQAKMVKEGQHKSLKNEVERLKMNYGHHRRSRSAASCFDETADHSGASWQMLDMENLNLGRCPFPLNFGIECWRRRPYFNPSAYRKHTRSLA